MLTKASLRAIFPKAPDVDLVIILTSMPEHARLATAALRAGKHVLLEKPLATTLEDARALVECAKHSAGHLVCAPPQSHRHLHNA